MAKMSLVSVDSLAPGMKLGAAVVTSSGQTILTAGTTLDETHIRFLERRGIQKVHVAAAADYGVPDVSTYEQTLDKLGSKTSASPIPSPESVDVSTIDPGGPMVVLEKMPSDVHPPDSPTKKEVDIEEIEKTNTQWRADRTVREKHLAEKHGEAFKKVVKALGEPKILTPDQKFQPAKLFCDAVKDMTQEICLEKNLNETTLDLLTKNIATEIISRQGMSTLLSRAQAAGQYLLAHMVNVGVYSMYMAIQMELSSDEIRDVSIGGLLADIGMLSLPEQFWVLDRNLWKKEQNQLRQHPPAGHKMITECPGASPVWARIALEHHERLDGSGYPNGLKAEAIDIHSRIVQICDVYSAATADRAYRDAHFPDDAMRQIMGRPHLFDRSLVEIFCQMVGFFPEGYLVLLSSGEQAAVLKTNPKNVFRPTVRLTKDKNGRPLPPGSQIAVDLNTRLDIRIIRILEDDTVRWV